MDQQKLDLFKQSWDGQMKYGYFIMTLNAAAIGYSVSIPPPEKVDIRYLILILSWIIWGLSLYYGSRYIESGLEAIKSNLLDAEVTEWENSSNPLHQAAAKEARKQIAERKKPKDAFKKLFYFFIMGAILFLIWHVSNLNWDLTYGFECF